MEKRILVTGGSGYVGSVLVPYLAARGWPVRVLETMEFGNPIAGTPNVEFIQGDIRNRQDVEAALEGCAYVVHLAGIVTDELAAMNPILAVQTNCEAMVGLCLLARAQGIARFIYASSASVYGASEQPCTEATPPAPMSIYAETKLEGEHILKAHLCPGFVGGSLRSATCSGPAPRMRLDTIVNVFCKQAYFDKRITVFDGRQWRSNIHVRDVARAYEVLLRAPKFLVDGLAFNVTAGNHTALEIARMVAGIIPAEIVVDREKVDNRHYKMDATTIRKALGFEPRWSIQDAIVANLAWFEAGMVPNPSDSIYYNTQRMAARMKEGV